ncbi:MAG TPA: beta-ketoacyl-[acyl-carrier-protein] synthase family protein [Microlunatus sp.]
MTRRQVAISGVGWITSLGSGSTEVWESLLRGVSKVGPLTRFDASELPSRIASEVHGHSDTPGRRTERFVSFALAAARDAIIDAGLTVESMAGERSAVVLGTAYGGIARVEQESGRLARHLGSVPPQVSMTAAPTSAAASVAIAYGVTGGIECPNAACASGAAAVVRAHELVANGRVDVVLAGGTDAAISPLPMRAFCAARALSRRNTEPIRASRPFDRGRDGFVFGEGSAILVVEALDRLVARRGRPVALLSGTGHSSDAYHLGTPDPEGGGASRSMRAALTDADSAPGEVGLVSAHAASTPLGDRAEAAAIRTVFSDRSPPTMALKSMTGHLLGASGAFEAAATALAVQQQRIPPTLNVEDLDPACDLDIVSGAARDAPIDVALTNSIGLGGINYTLAFTRAA